MSEPFEGPLIVVFGNSRAERAAVHTLTDERPGSTVVQFGSFIYTLLKTRCIGVVVFVAHGAADGIVYRGEHLVSFRSILSEISMMPAKQIMIAACGSGVVASMDRSGRVFGFQSLVDAELAAFAVAIRAQVFYRMYNLVSKTFDRFVDVLAEKLAYKDAFLPLHFDDGTGGGGGGGGSPSLPTPTHSLSSAELFNLAMIFALGCVFALVGLGISAAAGKLGSAISAKLSGASSSGLLSALYNFFVAVGPAGVGSALALVTTMFGGLGQLASAWFSNSIQIVQLWISMMNPAEWAALIAITGLEVIIAIITAGAEPMVRLQAGIAAAVINTAVIAVSDYNDNNDVPCQSVMEAISQLS
ncbi:MAG: hypothetical protein ACP6IT_04070 [Candidatus Thorarchaeota archaeon]